MFEYWFKKSSREWKLMMQEGNGGNCQSDTLQKVRKDGLCLWRGWPFVGNVERRQSPWGMCGSLRKLSFDCFYFLGEIEKMIFRWEEGREKGCHRFTEVWRYKRRYQVIYDRCLQSRAGILLGVHEDLPKGACLWIILRESVCRPSVSVGPCPGDAQAEKGPRPWASSAFGGKDRASAVPDLH